MKVKEFIKKNGLLIGTLALLLFLFFWMAPDWFQWARDRDNGIVSETTVNTRLIMDLFILQLGLIITVMAAFVPEEDKKESK